jgi:hypothetical protein
MSGYLSSLLPTLEEHFADRAKADLYFNDPVLWAKDMLDVDLWSKQREIAYAVRDNSRVAVAAGHGVGKSFVAAVLMAWWIDNHPLAPGPDGFSQTMVASTAPFQEQISAILWNNLRQIHTLSKMRFEQGLIDHALPGRITGENKWKLDDGTLIGQGRKPPDNKADSGYQGLHATFLFAVGDEAAGLDKEMIGALGNITTGEHNRLLLIANPTDPSSEMAKIWKEKKESWHTMHISVFDSPRVTDEPGFPEAKKAALSGWKYINEKKDDWGEDDPQYISRVLGQWAFDSGNNLFTEVDLAHAANAHVLPDPEAIIEFGCDIARMGKDGTFVYTYQEGEVWECDPETNQPIRPKGERGGILRYLADWKKAPLVGDDPENLGTSQRIHAHALAMGAKIVKVDASGLGSGVIDGLAMLNRGQYRVVEIFGGAASSDPRAWINARAEQYFELKRRFFAGIIDVDPKDVALLDDLRGIIFEFNDKGSRKIESKDSIKRKGGKSPDIADTAWYAAMNVDHLISGPQPGDIVTRTPAQLLREMELSGFRDPYPM